MTRKPTRVRITDIAQRANVSPGTVDRVLHHRGEVSTKTRERILKIIQDMNYQPDLLASTLASKKTFHFASLIPAATNDTEFWSLPAHGIRGAYNHIKHYGVFATEYCFGYFDRQSFKNASERLLASKPDGAIVAPVFADLAESFVSRCVELAIPVVFINANIFNLPKLSFVGQDSFRSGMVAASLLDYGMQGNNPVYVVNIMSEKGTNTHLLSREEGFRSYFSDLANNRCKTITINIRGNDLQRIYEALGEYLVTHQETRRPGGIFVTNSRVYLVADYLKNMHIKNIRLIGYDLLDVNISHLQEGIIQFLISQKPFDQGYKSLMSLFDHFVMKKEVPKYQYLPIDIITRENIDYYLGQHPK